ncbi:two-component system, chemotaxis family, sensor kinase CheA [Desulfosarcina sp. BuS5]|uniref:chemotaxis protein CheA n=1 Tax=Desulfosarcina sp. BuS5 TaxID=933262 RepID=UPI000487644A|nr:chemotaxis protein CheA [Desulfosarcina sp. BuS5]WDN89349.1 two-component system, chemotaxis family, sensor kinase CheA [Desulfosarcina sp. BuS5]
MSQSNIHAETYRLEALELLSDVEEAILDVEQDSGNAEHVNRLFRAMHTIKGSGAMFGFDDIADFTHHAETVLDKVRESAVPVNKDLIDLILASSDQIRAMLQATDGGAPVDISRSEQIVAGLKALLHNRDDANAFSPENMETSDAAGSMESKKITCRIRFRPGPSIFATGMDPALLLDELRDFGNCIVTAQTENIPALYDLDPEQCYIFWDMVLSTDRSIDDIRDVFIFVDDESEIKIDEITCDANMEKDRKRLGEILVERGDVTKETVDRALNNQKQIGELLVESGAVSRERVASALSEQQIIEKRKAPASSGSVRVPADRLDNLINLVGELVITQARLTQVSAGINDPKLAAPVEEVERLAGELRDCVLNIRMLPIGTTFSKFRRLVRDLSSELGKEIELKTEGAETELDKTVIERLDNPLVHLIRNSIDHGIESPEEREVSGKSRKGAIRLAAEHKGADVVITIEDDGRGLDAEVIKSKAIEKGLIETGDSLIESEIFKLVFTPGFSTNTEVTSVSGRGVGMDVVKREIEALRGSIEIFSEKGEGTAVRLSLPLTLAIIDGLLVKAGKSRFVLPLSVVEECMELTKDHVANAHGRHLISVRGELVPYIRLRDIFAVSGGPAPLEQMVVVKSENMRVGIVVDEIIGSHQTVIKSLGRMYQDAEGVSGGTILGDGGIALIVDVPKIIQCAEEEEKAPKVYLST